MSGRLIPGLRRAARGARRLRSAVLDPVRRWRADRCFRLESRDRDAYLVSYPRSGRHWVGFFLATLIRSRIPDPPERIDFHTWERVVPNIDRMIPEHMLRIRAYRHRPDPRIFLSHHQSDPRMRRAVYLVRDPRDAVVSQFYEHQRMFARPIRELGAFVEAALAGRIWPGPWGGHVEGWLARRDSGDVLVVRYEDLHAEPLECFPRIARFLGLDGTGDELRAAFAASRLDAMRAVEADRGTPGHRGDPGVTLVRRGRVGGWRDELEPHLARRIEETWGGPMARLGYAPGERA